MKITQNDKTGAITFTPSDSNEKSLLEIMFEAMPDDYDGFRVDLDKNHALFEVLF